MATRTGFRNILGDITKQQNIPRKVALVDAKVTTRQAAATKKLTSEVVSDGHGDQATERFVSLFMSILYEIISNVFLYCTKSFQTYQEPACWCG